LIPNVLTLEFNVYVHDRLTGTTELVSLSPTGEAGNADSGARLTEYLGITISFDGRYVAFMSFASNLIVGDMNGRSDVFLRDRLAGTTELIDLTVLGTQATSAALIGYSNCITPDGRYVAFTGADPNLVTGYLGGHADVFLRDRVLGRNELISVANDGSQGNDQSGSYDISVSPDGRFVAFGSSASNLGAGDQSSDADLFVRDRLLQRTELLTLGNNGNPGYGSYAESGAALTPDGRYAAFTTPSTFDLNDSNPDIDVYIRDRDATSFTSTCEPGSGGVISCPCSNPPTGPGMGCDNSALTGGATLLASGIAYLSMDSLTFSTSDERPDALSILVQSKTVDPTGSVYGMGVRCVSGRLVRLFSKSATLGRITVPDVTLGDPSISQRSAILGDSIGPGEDRWYFVAYRDHRAVTGCPQLGSFNATQTARIRWWL